MRCMTKLILLLTLFLTVSSFGQTSDRAVPAYSVNEKLIGLSNLIKGLRDCPVRSVMGKVKDFDTKENTVIVKLKVDKKTTAEAVIPLDRVPDEDRRPLFRHLITKNNTIRVSGYSCSQDEPFSAFSIDRVY